MTVINGYQNDPGHVLNHAYTYSLLAVVQIIATAFPHEYYRTHRFERMMGWLLLSALMGIQCVHLIYLHYQLSFIHDPVYYIFILCSTGILSIQQTAAVC